jgi:hypothetical protein
MEISEEIELYRLAIDGMEAKIEKYEARIADLEGTAPKKRGRRPGSKNGAKDEAPADVSVTGQ